MAGGNQYSYCVEGRGEEKRGIVKEEKMGGWKDL